MQTSQTTVAPPEFVKVAQNPKHILVCYDYSHNAQAAIEFAIVHLFTPHDQLTIFTVIDPKEIDGSNTVNEEFRRDKMVQVLTYIRSPFILKSRK